MRLVPENLPQKSIDFSSPKNRASDEDKTELKYDHRYAFKGWCYRTVGLMRTCWIIDGAVSGVAKRRHDVSFLC
jgi:hypothetical protein